MKTLEEVKRALKCCSSTNRRTCFSCPYFNDAPKCVSSLCSDAHAYFVWGEKMLMQNWMQTLATQPGVQNGGKFQ